MSWERVSGLTNLILRKEIERFVERWGEGRGAEKRIQWWSESGKGRGRRLDRGREEEQTRSRVWPLAWVGKLMCWVR